MDETLELCKILGCASDKTADSAEQGEVKLPKIQQPRIRSLMLYYKDKILAAFERGYTKNAILNTLIATGVFPQISKNRFYQVWREVMPKNTVAIRSNSDKLAMQEANDNEQEQAKDKNDSNFKMMNRTAF